MIRNVKTGIYTKNGEEINFDFYTTLRAYDKIRFINFVTNILIDDNYNSVIRDMTFDIAIVHILTDIDVSNILNSTDAINQIEDFLDETNIVEIVKENAVDLIEELNKAVNDNIAYRTGIHKNPIAESLSHLINTLESKVSNVDTESIMKMAQIINNMSGELTTEKMIDAYVKSDIFKQNQEQISRDREQHIAKIESIGSEVKNKKNVKKAAPVNRG